MLSNADVELISNCMLFAGSEPPTWFLDGVRRLGYARGEAAYTPGEFHRALAIVSDGVFEVANSSGIALNTLRRGDVFGVAAVFGGEERYVSTVRAKHSGYVLFFESGLLERLFLEHPQCALRYVKFLTGRIRFLNAKIEDFTAPNAQDAVEHWLVTAATGGDSVTVTSWSAVSRALGMSRTSLYRALDILESDGRITRNGKQVTFRRDEI